MTFANARLAGRVRLAWPFSRRGSVQGWPGSSRGRRGRSSSS